MSFEKFKEFIIHKFRNEISEDLTYHNLEHTLSVLEQSNNYINRLYLNPKDANLLRTAALIHDIGFLWVYDNHEQRGVDFAKEELPKWGYSESDIRAISGMIMATKIPQDPKTLLEEIICDADLDYLGTDKFIPIGNTLHQEFLKYNKLTDDDDWNSFQVKFLKFHNFRTDFAKEFRDPIKQQHIKKLLPTNNSF